MWEWAISPPLPVPSWGVGRAPSLEDAKTGFKWAWVPMAMPAVKMAVPLTAGRRQKSLNDPGRVTAF
jgi:hypothetical protein